MQNFYIPAASHIPEIYLNGDTGVLSFSGECYPQDTSAFFKPVMEWLKAYIASSNKQIEVNFRMSYFSPASARAFLEIIQLLERYEAKRNGKVSINWYSAKEDTDMVETGSEYAYETSLDFRVIKY